MSDIDSSNSEPESRTTPVGCGTLNRTFAAARRSGSSRDWVLAPVAEAPDLTLRALAAELAEKIRHARQGANLPSTDLVDAQRCRT
jgi:hypothetical protein